MTPSAMTQQHRTTVTITHHDGRTVSIPAATETCMVNPLTGEQTLLVEQHRYQTADRRIVKPEELAFCSACNKPIAPQATSFCEYCQALLCKHCAQQPPRCSSCRKTERRRKFLAWLTSL
jgi:predicted sulfurtransferase